MARNTSRRPSAPLAALFDMCVHGKPISSQTGRRKLLAAWKRQAAESAKAAWHGPPVHGMVRIRVTYYCESTQIDNDNLIKPIQDALQGILYLNDRQCLETEGRRRDINGALQVRYISSALALAFSNGRPFIHIEVWDNPNTEQVL